MKNIIEVVKANKGAIAKRGLIAIGAIGGLALATKMLIGRGTSEEETVEAEYETDMDVNEDSEEE